MSFRNLNELKAALAWFKTHTNQKFPDCRIADSFTDDHEDCYVVEFKDVFTFTFWWVGPEFAFNLGAGDADVTGSIAHILAGVLEDYGSIQFWYDTKSGRGDAEYTELDEATLQDVKDFVKKYQNT